MRLLTDAYKKKGDLHQGEEEAVKVTFIISLIIADISRSESVYCSVEDIYFFPVSVKVKFYKFSISRGFGLYWSVTPDGFR